MFKDYITTPLENIEDLPSEPPSRCWQLLPKRQRQSQHRVSGRRDEVDAGHDPSPWGAVGLPTGGHRQEGRQRHLPCPAEVRLWRGLPDAGATFYQPTVPLPMAPAPRQPLKMGSMSGRFLLGLVRLFKSSATLQSFINLSFCK